MKKDKQGFFLIELMVVCAICAILACLSVVSLHEFNHFYLRSHLEYLYATCMHMQKYAVIHQQHLIIYCDEKNHAIIINGKEQKFPSPIKFGFFSYAYGSPGDIKEPIKKAITFKDHTIYFYPDGTISSGSIYLTDAHHKYMYALTIPIGMNGYIKKYKYDGACWSLLT